MTTVKNAQNAKYVKALLSFLLLRVSQSAPHTVLTVCTVLIN